MMNVALLSVLTTVNKLCKFELQLLCHTNLTFCECFIVTNSN